MTKVTKKVEEEFLLLIASGLPIMHACKKVGVTRKTMYEHRAKRARFKKAWDEAVEDGRQTKIAEMEQEADRRAVKGTPEPIYYKGKRVGWRLRHSDSLLLARLKVLDPERYGDKAKGEGINATGDVTINVIREYE